MFKKLLFSLVAILFVAASATAAIVAPATQANVDPVLAESFLGADQQITTADFLSLTPRKIREATGKKLTLKESIGLKLMQKKIKKEMRRSKKADDEEFPKGLFIVCAIFLPIAAVIFMGIMDDWEGNTWWVAAILYALCYLPGLIYTLTKMKNYYPSK